ncbi:hydroxyisourate hydrolase [Peribacillus simplex]|uniref:5-hydroxyisourate hydrolase n=1 Tax=Peribacillus simplex TaxID=1478 RepID=A0A8B5Y2U7_9BACI|nr:hydroxyisourate hydrolase [Peribacillus simplex]MED3983143.1 hydroxyisourate hydrolase [Peribacillus simplex]MED4095313.1 hydroxyisourate hydrolase [Peribacillus simplex]TVX83017.1 hydroxyisourate hydrolase [Peribacillus simplex]CAH0197478.1 5-hydroxyisourate hydrolase [Peribacillus simplex]
MPGITTHILDLMHGQPAENVTIELYFSESSTADWQLLQSAVTNTDGRLDAPLLNAENTKMGNYEIVFHIGDYFRNKSIELPDPPFLDQVPVRFGLSSPSSHYHVPLLVSPWGYQVYRGS